MSFYIYTGEWSQYNKCKDDMLLISINHQVIRIPPLKKSNDSIELSMIIGVIAGISVNPVVAIAQDTFFGF